MLGFLHSQLCTGLVHLQKNTVRMDFDQKKKLKVKVVEHITEEYLSGFWKSESFFKSESGGICH